MPHNKQQHQPPAHRSHIIMAPEDVAAGKKPQPWHALEIVGSVRNLSPLLWDMTHLTTLYLNENCLSRIPPDIAKLTQLRNLDLSNNKLRALPRELGELILLEELLLNDNQLRTLPWEMGKLFHLKRLNLRGNPLGSDLLQIYQEPKGTQKLINYLLEHLSAQYPAPRPPQRPWVLMEQPSDRTKPSCMFTTMCYNVLCDKYATRQLYGYCPAWALNWDYRKQAILDELKAYSADIIALQEVETEQFHNHFLRALKQDGYEGIFSPKSRAKTMSEFERKHVDGCAIFYKSSKFSLIQEHLVEFNQLAMANAEGSDDMLNRVMTKDNIALVALLQIKDGAFDSFQTSGSSNVSGSIGPGTIGISGSGNSGPGSGNSGDNGIGTGVNNLLDSSSAGGVSVASMNNISSGISLNTRPLHQQRLLVCAAHIHWDPEFCDVKIIQTIMLMHELQAIANQATKDLLASSGENAELVKQYYLKHSKSSDSNHSALQTGKSTKTSNSNNHQDNHDNHADDYQDKDDEDDENSAIEKIGPDLIPLILCVDSNSFPESSVVEFLSNGGISAEHEDFKKLAYKNCLTKICNSKSSAMVNPLQNQYWNNQAHKQQTSITRTVSSSSASSGDGDQQQKSPNDNSTASNGNGDQRLSVKNGNHRGGLTLDSDYIYYTHPFSLDTAYTGEGAMAYTNYTFDFKGVIDYIFYSKNLMSVLGVSGLDKTWLVENKIPGLPHPYFPSDHLPLYVELEILPSPRNVPVNRYKLLQQPYQQHQHQLQLSQLPPSQSSQHNRKNDFFQTPMRKPFFGT